MKHPSSKAIFAVADRLQLMVPLAPKKDNLNMDYSSIHEMECGTVCCHGGWYAVANNLHRRTNDKVIFIGFGEGVERLGRDLGFEGMWPLLYWAEAHPEIWGNPHGGAMFASKIAFASEKRPKGAKTLQDIVDHWREVGERVKALESPVYEDITQTLVILPIEETSDLIITKTKENVYS